MTKAILSSYIKKNTFIHKLNPLTKLIFLVAVIITVFAVKSFIYNLIIVLAIIPLAYSAKLLSKVFKPLRYLFIIFIVLYGIQSFLYPEKETILIDFGYGIAIWEEGVLFATIISLRLLAMIVHGYFFVLVTHPGDLVCSLRKIKFPYKFGYIVLSTLQVIPRVASQMETIIDAQKSRGLETKGSIANRLKAYSPLLGPLFLGSVQNVVERTIALESRAFSYETEKTSYRETYVRKKDKIIMASIVVFFTLYGVISWIL
ncbi:MAG: energy-coupling factor transporter transmembrane component T [Candidatus Nanoarchaeia archaeon]|nr:energy-coupling factor transporter transmembrane component T [Candidatus Nanoarchaeia archaeon]